MKTSSSIKGTMLSLSALLLAATTQTSQAAITVHFVEEGDNVRVSFSGVLDLSGANPMDAVPATVGSGIRGPSVNAGGDEVFSDVAGVATEDIFVFRRQRLPIISEGGDGIGFANGFIRWSNRHVTGGSSSGGVTELTADPTLDFFVVGDQSFDTLFTSRPADGTVLWTSNGTAEDTFVFSTTAPVPEPSSTLLLGFGAFAFLSRRQR